MKRLKNKILSMEPNTTTYKAMYEGSMTIIDPASTMPPYVDYSSTYYNENIGFDISTTHKLAQDKPTVVISIPCATLGIDIPDKSTESVEADFCLRAFKKYIDELNEELYNRSRPDNENGKYYLCAPGGEIIKRNTAYFALCPQKDYTNGSGSTVYLLSDGISRPPLMCLCIRIQVQFPLKKLRKTFQMMCRDLPDAVDRFVLDFDIEGLKKATELAKKQSSIRAWLNDSDYCAFVANGSILPRAKGRIYLCLMRFRSDLLTMMKLRFAVCVVWESKRALLSLLVADIRANPPCSMPFLPVYMITHSETDASCALQMQAPSLSPQRTGEV